MRKIEFVTGYYEWVVFADGEAIKAFYDFSGDFDEEITTEEQVESIVCETLNGWELEERENDLIFPLSKEETDALYLAMIERLKKHYCVD